MLTACVPHDSPRSLSKPPQGTSRHVDTGPFIASLRVQSVNPRRGGLSIPCFDISISVVMHEKQEVVASLHCKLDY
jgi:hypothetical protein